MPHCYGSGLLDPSVHRCHCRVSMPSVVVVLVNIKGGNLLSVVTECYDGSRESYDN